MSDESATPPETSSTPSADGPPQARRISTPRPKKQAKSPKVAGAPDEGLPEPAPKSSKFPEFPEISEVPAPRNDWPEPEAASSGASSTPENPKRKRRRKKGKGNQSQNAASQPEGESPAQGIDEITDAPAAQPQAQPPRHNQAPRPKLDAEMLAKNAWKIYLAEISEEGVALVGDNDAKELSRRCFRLAEIFMEEQARRRA